MDVKTKVSEAIQVCVIPQQLFMLLPLIQHNSRLTGPEKVRLGREVIVKLDTLGGPKFEDDEHTVFMQSITDCSTIEELEAVVTAIKTSTTLSSGEQGECLALALEMKGELTNG